MRAGSVMCGGIEENNTFVNSDNSKLQRIEGVFFYGRMMFKTRLQCDTIVILLKQNFYVNI